MRPSRLNSQRWKIIGNPSCKNVNMQSFSPLIVSNYITVEYNKCVSSFLKLKIALYLVLCVYEQYLSLHVKAIGDFQETLQLGHVGLWPAVQK